MPSTTTTERIRMENINYSCKSYTYLSLPFKFLPISPHNTSHSPNTQNQNHTPCYFPTLSIPIAKSNDDSTFTISATAAAAVMSLSPDLTAITTLIHSEPFHLPSPTYLHRLRTHSINLTSRQDSINWILKVNTHFHFKPVTAFLSINYLDRFLSSHSFPQSNRWAFQLLSVACLSLAAKMEEPFVPLLLDLQALNPTFLFEAKTVQRMEIRVLSVLHWRLRSVTPFDFIDFFISKLPSGSPSPPDCFSRVFSVSSDLILSTTRVIDFLDFSPSTIAASAVISAAGETFDFFPTSNGEELAIFHERINTEKVRSCHRLMEEYLIDTCSAVLVAEPPSPVGILDAAACKSCDTPSDVAHGDPPAKRARLPGPDE